MSRKSSPGYVDGIHSEGIDSLPNPRRLSKLFFRGESGVLSTAGRSVFFAFFGKFSNCKNYEKVKLTNNKKIKSLYFGITPKYVTSGGVHILGLALGDTASKKHRCGCEVLVTLCSILPARRHISKWLHRKFPLCSPAI